MGGYTEAAIPADHPSMLSLARQSGIAVNGVRYPISIADRSVISRFIGACNRPG
jgi:hypothetical protein